MKTRSKERVVRTPSIAELQTLAEKCVEKMPMLGSYDYDFMWHDLDAFRETWLEYRANPDDYDFYEWLDSIAEEKHCRRSVSPC